MARGIRRKTLCGREGFATEVGRLAKFTAEPRKKAVFLPDPGAFAKNLAFRTRIGLPRLCAQRADLDSRKNAPQRNSQNGPKTGFFCLFGAFFSEKGPKNTGLHKYRD
jgi:hypothetical protein